MPPSDFDYEDIIDALREGDAVLFLGPQLLRDVQGRALEEGLYDELGARQEDHPLIRTFYEEDGFFLLKEENHRRRLVRQVRRFYEKEHSAADELLQKLARIPFPLFVSLTPDGLLQRAFDAQRQDYRSDFYYRGQPYEPYVDATRERPLLYGMLGSLSQADSLVLTHKDLFAYLESVFAGKSMAPELRKHIQDARTFIFLGLPFEKWYMQLLLRVLYHISSRLESLEQYASHPQKQMKHTIFEEEFKIKFVPDAGPDFIRELYRRCEEEGLLKPVPEESPRHRYRSLLQESQGLLRKNHILQGIDKLRLVLEAHRPLSDGQLDDLTLQERTYNELNHKLINGMAQEADRAALNQAIYRCITLVSDTQKLLEL